MAVNQLTKRESKELSDMIDSGNIDYNGLHIPQGHLREFIGWNLSFDWPRRNNGHHGFTHPLRTALLARKAYPDNQRLMSMCLAHDFFEDVVNYDYSILNEFLRTTPLYRDELLFAERLSGLRPEQNESLAEEFNVTSRQSVNTAYRVLQAIDTKDRDICLALIFDKFDNLTDLGYLDDNPIRDEKLGYVFYGPLIFTIQQMEKSGSISDKKILGDIFAYAISTEYVPCSLIAALNEMRLITKDHSDALIDLSRQNLGKIDLAYRCMQS